MTAETTLPEAAHKHAHPVRPPAGSLWAPGPCECGKTYAQAEADRILATALEQVAEAYGVPARVSEQWAVAWGGDDLNDGKGYVDPRDDEQDAREHLQWIEGGSVVRRTVIALAWTAAPAEGEPQP